MLLFRKPPALGSMPTVRGGVPADPDTQEQVVINQVRAAEQWNTTFQEVAVNEMAQRAESVRGSRLQVLILGLLVIALVLCGLIYTAGVRHQDRAIASAHSAVEQTPYVPEAIH